VIGLGVWEWAEFVFGFVVMYSGSGKKIFEFVLGCHNATFLGEVAWG